MNNKKGEQVFGENIDAILTDKIIDHTEKSSERATRARLASDDPERIGHHASGRRRRRDLMKRLRTYGIASLALLALLGIVTLLLRRRLGKD